MNHEHIWRPSPTGSRRVLLMLHGTGGDEHSLLDLADAMDEEASVLSVRGNVREGSSNRFFRRLSEGVFDLEDLNRRTNDLADFLNESSAQHAFNLDAVVAVGFSNGANIAASLLLRRPESIGAGILIRSMVPFEPSTTPNLIGKRVLMLSGDRDPLVEVSNAQSLASMFRAYGAEITFELLTAGHDFTRRDLELSQGWLASLT